MALLSFTGNGVLLKTLDPKCNDLPSPYLANNGETQSDVLQPVAANDEIGMRYSDGQPADQTSQIVNKSGPYIANDKHVCVRAGAASRGYSISFTNLSGDTFSEISIYKDGSWLASAGSKSFSRLSDQTMKITVSGTSTVTIKGFVGGVEEISTTDSSSPITSGEPGFWNKYIAQAAARWAYWTDLISAAINLSGSASGAVTTSADLTTAIAIKATALMSAGTTGNLATAISMAASSMISGDTSADLTTQINLAASALIDGISSGDLTTQILFAGAAVVAGTSVGALSTQINLSGSATGSITAAGDLSVGINLAGQAQVTAQATGNLTTAITLAASEAASASTSAALTTAIRLVGQALIAAESVGNLSTLIQMAADALVSAQATGTLSDAALTVPVAQKAKGIVAYGSQAKGLVAYGQTAKGYI